MTTYFKNTDGWHTRDCYGLVYIIGLYEKVGLRGQKYSICTVDKEAGWKTGKFSKRLMLKLNISNHMWDQWTQEQENIRGQISVNFNLMLWKLSINPKITAAKRAPG